MRKLSVIIIIIVLTTAVIVLDNYFHSSGEGSVLRIGSQSPRPGIYQGRASGFAGEIVVEVIFERSVSGTTVMKSIRIIHSEDIDKYWKKAEDNIVERILQSQDTDVDAVTGATHSSRGILEAVKDAYKKAVQGI